jgi:hypothetical protein
MKVGILGALLALVALGTGCNTVMHGTAPAKAGYIYAVGSRNSQPTVWICPDAAGKGECHPITVDEQEK